MKGATMAFPPRTSVPTALAFVLGFCFACVAIVVTMLTRPEFYSARYCSPDIQLSYNTTVQDAIEHAANNVAAAPVNIKQAVEHAPGNVLYTGSARICFDESKRHVASINGKRIPKDS